MYNIVIDFGTTNTLIGVYNLETKEIKIEDFSKLTVKIGDYSAIPSKIGYINSEKFFVGVKAEKLSDKQIFNRMKLYFSKYNSIKRKFGKSYISHQQAAKDFLSIIIDFILIKYPLNQIEKFIMTAPVDSFDTYRSFLTELCEQKNIFQYQILDEPTAVALGYNAVVSPDYPYMIVDFGGGTLDINIVRLNNANKVNKVDIIAKSGIDLGGIDIDNWLLYDFRDKQNLRFEDMNYYKRDLLTKIEQLKIQLSYNNIAEFIIEDKQNDFEMNYKLTRNEFNEILKRNNFQGKIQDTVDTAIDRAETKGIKKKQIKKVFLVGGSSQLSVFQEMFHINFNNKVENDEPFAAAIRGACNFISGTITEDFLHHNYSLQHYNKRRGIYEYEVIVPEKTKFPINNVKQLIIATPFSGQSEIELKFFEILSNVFSEEKIEDITFDENGNLKVIKNYKNIESEKKIIPLNSDKDCFIKLDPPSIASKDRIKLTFHINKNRILTVDAVDLITSKSYYNKFEIARLK